MQNIEKELKAISQQMLETSLKRFSLTAKKLKCNRKNQKNILKTLLQKEIDFYEKNLKDVQKN